MPCRTDLETGEKVSSSVGSHADGWYNDWLEIVGYKFVDEIMASVFLEEWNTATAQISLCEDVDRTMATVCQRYPGRSPHSQWFTRWRRCDREVWDPVPVHRTSSQSSSQVSFHSTRDEPALFQNGPVDFHGIAATWGLSRYVIAKFDMRQSHPDDKYVDYLLCCSLLARNWYALWHDLPGWLVGTFNLMTDLLSRGGNLNIYVERYSNTIWGVFLVSWDSQTCQSPSRAQEVLIASTTTAKAFLKAGADAHMKCSSQLFVPGSLQSLGLPNSDKRLQIHLHSKISALYIVRKALKAVPEWKAVEDIILAKGGRESYEFTHVTIFTDHTRPYTVSERKHKKLVVALNAAHRDYVKEYYVKHLRSLLEKICSEHLAGALTPYGETASDDDISSDASAEEEFYESLDC